MPLAPHKGDGHDRNSSVFYVLLIMVMLLDILLFSLGIIILIRGSALGAIFALPVAILTRSIIRGIQIHRRKKSNLANGTK